MTKADIVYRALSELGIADYEFDSSPEELASGASRLDSMMSAWAHKGLKIAYNYEGGLNDETGLPAVAHEAVFTNLAVRLSSSYGKQPAPSLLSTAKGSYNVLLSESLYPAERQLASVPFGAGYKRVTDHFYVPSPRKYPWEIPEFENYAGGSDIQLGDVGTAIRISLAGSADLSTAIAQTIRYRKPSGTTGEWPATVVGDSVEYITEAGDIDEAGVWYVQAYFDLTTWQGTSKVVSLRVEDSIVL